MSGYLEVLAWVLVVVFSSAVALVAATLTEDENTRTPALVVSWAYLLAYVSALVAAVVYGGLQL